MDDLVDEVTKALMKVNEHTEGFTYSQLIREMAMVAVAICGEEARRLRIDNARLRDEAFVQSRMQQ